MTLQPGMRFCCVFCLTEDALILRVDRKGRPYLMCDACRTRIFVHGPNAWRGPMTLFGKLVAASRMADPEAAAAELVRREQARPVLPIQLVTTLQEKPQ